MTDQKGISMTYNLLCIACRDELPSDVRAAAEKLGYNQKYWDRDKVPKECDEFWKDLTPEQQE